jgi:ribonuclease HI
MRTGFTQENSQCPQQLQSAESEPNNSLDGEVSMAHLADIGVANLSRTNELSWATPELEKRNPEVTELVAYVDGGCLGNPGPSGIGVVISGLAEGPVRIAKWIGNQDNNVAEYAALMEALQYAVSLKARKLHVYSDSQVVVRQMTGEYVCRSPRLYSLHWTCRKLARSLKFSISHVRREFNVEANRLAQSALRKKALAR